MITTFHGKKITGMLTVLPETVYDFDKETARFSTPRLRRLKRVMGYGTRRAAKAATTTGDLCHYAMQYLLDEGLIHTEEVGGILVLGLTPDYFVPHNSNILHGEFDFPKDVVCMDTPQGCCGFIMGFMQACMLLEHMPDKKILVFTADVLNRKDPAAPIAAETFGGDACTVTVVENDLAAQDIPFSFYTDGKNREALILHAGAYRMPHSPETAIPRDIGDGNGVMKCYDDLWMNGSMIFNFMQREVPPLIDEILHYAGLTKEDIEVFFFHQPNQFMLQKLAERLKVPFEKVPMNVVGKFGNSSGSTIPVTITYNYGQRLEHESVKCCMSGFGSGLAWGAAVMELGELDFCRITESNL